MNLKTRLTKHKRATRNGDVNNHIAEHHRLTNHTIDWDSAQCVTYSTNYFQRLTLESWFTNLEQTPQQKSTTTSTLQTTYLRHQHNQRTEQNDLTLPTDRNWPITTDKRYLSLTANNITAKLTNQFSPTRLITFDWQTTLSLDSDDDFCSGCQNVSHCHRQQSFSGLPSTGRSHYMIDITFCYYLLLCCKINLLLAENGENLISAQLSIIASNKHPFSRSRNLISTQGT